MDLHDNPLIIIGLSMDRIWIIHGLSMDDPWIIYGSSIDYLWIIHGHPWISMNCQGLGEAGGTGLPCWGTGQHIPGEPLGRETLTHSLNRK